jgi:hypothetical protein
MTALGMTAPGMTAPAERVLSRDTPRELQTRSNVAGGVRLAVHAAGLIAAGWWNADKPAT